MFRDGNWEGKNRARPNDIIGLDEIDTLDDLIRVKVELMGEKDVLAHEVIKILRKEFDSPQVLSALKSVRLSKADFLDLKQLTAVLHSIPDKLYYFLWSLKNSDLLPVEGVISSFQLQKAVFYLYKFLLVLEVFIKRAPRNIPVYENLGFVYLDLAGLAKYSRFGLLLKGSVYPHTALLRKAITCFQIALKLEARHGKELDAFHKNTLRLLDNSFDFRQSRINLYLNPWYFLYISSALRQLNDEEGAEAYLQKARIILNGLANHFNPRVKSQQPVLEAVYAILKDAENVRFDFEENEVTVLEKKIKHVRMEKRNGNSQRSCYSPLVEDALLQQYRQRNMFKEQRLPDPRQLNFLNSIFTLYRQVSSPAERDKLIYRLNIPPLKIKGRPQAMKRLLSRPNGAAHAQPPAKVR